MPSSIVDALTARGVVCVVRWCSSTSAEIVLDDGAAAPVPMQVRRVRGAPTPGAVERFAAHDVDRLAVGSHLLVVCDKVTAGAARRAAELGISLLAPAPARPAIEGTLLLPGREGLDLGEPEAGHDGYPSRVPWVPLQVLRLIALFGRSTQDELSRLTGVSQPRVSQALAELHLEGVRPRDLADRWLAAYPGPGGVATYWAGATSPRDQAIGAVDALRAAGVADVAVSADVGADLLAPWARPEHAVVYATTGVDLGGAGFVPAVSSQATLTLVVPQDRALLPTARRFRAVATLPDADVLPVADPLTVLHDLSQSPNVDRDQAAQALRRYVLRRSDEAEA